MEDNVIIFTISVTFLVWYLACLWIGAAVAVEQHEMHLAIGKPDQANDYGFGMSLVAGSITSLWFLMGIPGHILERLGYLNTELINAYLNQNISAFGLSVFGTFLLCAPGVVFTEILMRRIARRKYPEINFSPNSCLG